MPIEVEVSLPHRADTGKGKPAPRKPKRSSQTAKSKRQSKVGSAIDRDATVESSKHAQTKVKQRFAVALLSPPGYIHAQALSEIAETVHQGLMALGHDSVLTNTFSLPDRTSIIIGAHLLDRCAAGLPAPGSIIYNFEQMDPDSSWLNTAYMNLLRQFPVWDYSRRNIEFLKQIGIQHAQHVPIGWMPEMARIPSADQDIDVLFYGSINDRRLRILDQLRSRNVRVEQVFGVYGKQRDELVARSKIVLNLHYYESKIFELARVSYLLGNGVCVVSEDGFDPSEKKFAEAVAFAPYEELVETCLRLLANPEERKRLSRAGRELMQSFHEDDFLREALKTMETSNTMVCDAPSESTVPEASTSTNIPTVLNLGSGKDWKAEALNLDIEPEWGPDALYDLNQPLTPEGVVLETTRFGSITLKENHFELIHAYDVLEHIQQLTTAMSTCLAWLKEGGIFRINVPYDLSWGAWQDPTHVRAFNERSWLYYTDWFWYLGWNRWRFETASLQYVLSPIGQKLNQQGVPADDLIRVPRAVDSMLVELRKRPLTVDELAMLESRRPTGRKLPKRAASPSSVQNVSASIAPLTGSNGTAREPVNNKPTPQPDSNVGKWNGWYAELTQGDMGAFRYGDTETYQMAADFLSGLDAVEDWGCGAGGFKRFCKSPYVGVDGSKTPFADKIVDLCQYRTAVDGIMMRHVLEHNYQWEKVLANAVASAKKKFCLVLFTPFQTEGTKELAHNKKFGVDVPDLGFKREDIEKHFAGWDFTCKTLSTATGYGVEHIYFATRKTRVCIISANLGGIDECNMSKHVQQELPAGWAVDHFYYDSSNAKLRDKALHPRMQAKLYKMYAWELHPGYDYYIWLDAAFVISSKNMVKWMLEACGQNDMVVFAHPYRKSIKSEVEYCLTQMTGGDKYLNSRYDSEPLAEQLAHYYKEPGFKDAWLLAAGAFCYQPTATVKRMLQDWYLECCRWTCQDQISLPVVIQRHAVNAVVFNAGIFENEYLKYAWRGNDK